MNPLLLTTTSLKWELWVVGGVLLVILAMPVITLAAVTNLVVAGSGGAGGGTLYTGPGLASDTYSFGNCTYWAALLRAQAGRPIPNSWGNANTWSLNASLDGYLVDTIPTVGAIMQTTAGPLGHVAYVESVDPASGSWTISEMNYFGLDIVDHRSFTAAQASFYHFIH